VAARPPLDGGTILITGASSGIGRELARQLAGRAAALALVARRADRLEELAAELSAQHPRLRVVPLPGDLADGTAVTALVARAQQAVGHVDVLINNAGLADFALFERAAWDKLQQQLQVNVLALTRLTHALLPPMLARGRGGILNVSSGFGLVFMPAFAVYAATKHYVTAFSESLRLELRGTGVAVSQLCPGPVTTEFLEVAGNPTGRAVPSLVELTPERCARVALRGFARGRALIVPGALLRLLLGLGRATPRALLRLVLGWAAGWLRRRPAR
jgi:hypothetical protein